MATENFLSFHDLSLEIKPFRKPPSIILKKLSGYFDLGMNAIMGPSGSGKTTLLNILANRSGCTYGGHVLWNGDLIDSNIQTQMGYVMQGDILMPTLTVYENLMFSASLRLPPSFSFPQKKELVIGLMNELQIVKCADTRVGGIGTKRGVSGGQARRCSIGMELVTKPSILFLDEPTSGLDAATAIKLTQILKRLSDQGRNIIMSIHQPRYDIYKLFNRLVLLSQGDIVYQGAADAALSYFDDIGFKCDIHNNPADYFLDVIQENEDSTKLNIDNEVRIDLVESYKKSTFRHLVEERLKLVQNLNTNEQFRTTHEGIRFGSDNVILGRIKKIVRKIKRNDSQKNGIQTGFELDTGGHVVSKRVSTASRYNTNFWQQLMIVGCRTLVNYVRTPQIIISQFSIMLIYSLIVGWLFFQIDHSAKYGLQNRLKKQFFVLKGLIILLIFIRIGVLFFILMNEAFGSLSAISIFNNERILYLYEVCGGFYRVSVYFITKIFGDLIIVRSISILMLSIVAYWMVGFKADASSYLIFIATLILLSAASSSVAFFCSVSFKENQVATDVCSLIYVFMMVFGGLFVNTESIPSAIRWIKYGSIFRYAYNAFLINELRAQIFCDSVHHDGIQMAKSNKTISSQSLDPTHSKDCISGNNYLYAQGIQFHNGLDLWINHLALLAITLIFWSMAYRGLRRMKHT